MNDASGPTQAVAAVAGPADSQEHPGAGTGTTGRAVEIFASGMNGALQRLPKVRCASLPLLVPEMSSIQWRPHWPRVKTISLTFPAGLEFLPPRCKATEQHPG